MRENGAKNERNECFIFIGKPKSGKVPKLTKRTLRFFKKRLPLPLPDSKSTAKFESSVKTGK